MRHELRVVAHSYTTMTGWAIQPYCVCGWVGQPEAAGAVTIVSASYRRHIDEADTGGPF